jgi:transposase
MTKKKPTYTQEFKRECAELVIHQDYPISKAAKAMGVSESGLRKWVVKLNDELAGVTPKGKTQALTPEQQKIQELEKKIARIEMEKEILKKATALLMSDSLDISR